MVHGLWLSTITLNEWLGYLNMKADLRNAWVADFIQELWCPGYNVLGWIGDHYGKYSRSKGIGPNRLCWSTEGALHVSSYDIHILLYFFLIHQVWLHLIPFGNFKSPWMWRPTRNGDSWNSHLNLMWLGKVFLISKLCFVIYVLINRKIYDQFRIKR